MRNNILLLIATISLVFTACNKTKTDIDTSARMLEINTDLSSLAERFSVVDEPIEWTNSLHKSTQSRAVSFRKAWQLASLTRGTGDDTDTLSISCVAVNDGWVYIGSHLNNHNVAPEEAWGGEIAVVGMRSVGQFTFPYLAGSAYDPSVDYNDIEITDVDPNNLWIAGENNARGSVILDLDITIGVPASIPIMEMSIFGTSANSITLFEDELWVSSATHSSLPTGGGLLAIDKNSPDQINYSFTVAQAKQFDSNADYGVLLYGSSSSLSYIRVYDMRNRYSFVDYPLAGYDVTNLGKNAVDVSQNFVYLAMGDDGILKVDLTSGTIVNHFMNNGVGYANGVKVDGTYVYVAYGQGGFYLLDKTNLSVIGYLDTEYSCNYVDIDPGEPTVSNHVYLANGRAGLICLSRI